MPEIKTDAGDANPRRKWGLISVGLLFLFVLHLNRPVVDYDWVYFDDDINVVLNPHLTGGSWDSFKWAWSDFDYGRRYIPAGWIMFDVLFRLGGLNASVYHTASWLITGINSILLLLVTRRFLRAGNQGFVLTLWQETSALLVVAFLSAHPLRAETTGWCSSLLYLVAIFFSLVACLASFPRAVPGISDYSKTGFALFLLSLLVYPVCVALPAVLVLVSAWQSLKTETSLAAGFRAALRRYSSWLLAVLVVGSVNFYAARSHSVFGSAGGLSAYSVDARVQHAAILLAHYCRQIFFPGETSPFYGIRPVLPSFVHFFVAILLIVWAGLAIRRQTRTASIFLGLIFVASFLPFIGLLDQGQTASDRYSFFVLDAATISLVLLFSNIRAPWLRVSVAFGLLGGSALLIPRYRDSLSVWRNTDSLQARIDAITVQHPDPRLNFARPATYSFLVGRYADSRARLNKGFKRFGADPELVAAARYIENSRALLAPEGSEPPIPPYAGLHLDLARTHRSLGHAYAAQVHADFARTFTPLFTSVKSASPSPPDLPHR
jgi:hypothetical protein